jgi:hypothetical protein
MSVEYGLPRPVCDLRHMVRAEDVYRCCDSRDCGYKIVNMQDVPYCMYVARPEHKDARLYVISKNAGA